MIFLTPFVFLWASLMWVCELSMDSSYNQFIQVNKGLDHINDLYPDENKLTMLSFKKLDSLDHEKSGDLYLHAQKAKEVSDIMFNYIQSIKDLIASRSAGWGDETKSCINDDKNLEVSTAYFIKEKHGKKLRDSLDWYLKTMKSYLGRGNENAVHFKINTEDPPKDRDDVQKTWEEYYWEEIPSITAVTELAKFQNDVRNAEAEVVNWNYKQVGGEEQRFDNLVAVIKTDNAVVHVGEKYKARILLGVYNSTVTPQIEVNGRPLPANEIIDGVGEYESVASGIGEHKVDVKISVIDPRTSKRTSYAASTSYQVFQGEASISADKMNILYLGLDNPLTISTTDYREDRVIVSISGGAAFAKTGRNRYIIRPDGSSREVTVNVSVKMDDSSTKRISSQVYRVRKIPHPEVLFGSKNGGSISRGEVATVSQIFSGLGEGFAFEGLKYTVDSYTLIIAKKEGERYYEDVTGNRVSPTGRTALNAAKTGDVIVICNVVATGPAGKVNLSGVTLPVR